MTCVCKDEHVLRHMSMNRRVPLRIMPALQTSNLARQQQRVCEVGKACEFFLMEPPDRRISMY